MLFICVFGPVFLFCLPLIINQFSNTTFFCKGFGWHRTKDIEYTGFDGASNHGNCKRCGAKDLMLDSQGNWF